MGHNTKPADALALPASADNKIIELRDRESASLWEWADLLAALDTELCRNRGDQARLLSLVAGRASLDKSTLRHRLNMGRTFTPDVRAQVDDVLSYSQLEACRAAGDDWRQYALWAIESADDFGGTPAPVGAIRKRIRDDAGGAKPPTEPPWRQKCQRIIDLADSARRERDTPDAVRDVLARFASELSEAM